MIAHGEEKFREMPVWYGWQIRQEGQMSNAIDKRMFLDHLAEASKVVDSWPAWKRNLLGSWAIE